MGASPVCRPTAVVPPVPGPGPGSADVSDQLDLQCYKFTTHVAYKLTQVRFSKSKTNGSEKIGIRYGNS